MPRQVALTDLNCNLPISQQTKVKLNSLVSAGEAMAAATTGKKLQDEVTCPICLEYFDDPVSLDCDHSFCRACITQCWGGLTADVSCPQCRRAFPQGNLRPNRQLRSFVDAARELQLQAGREPAPERLCEKHQEPLKLFCREDEIPICVVCDRSKGHRGHTVIPAEEAAEEFQGRLQDHLKTLRVKRQKLLELKVSREKTSQEYLKWTQAERQKIVAEFQQLRQFLEEQERLLLAQLQKLDEMIAKEGTDTVTKLLEQISHLSERIRELEGTCQKPASEFLQDIRSTLSRCEKGQAQQPEEMAPELEKRVHGFSRKVIALSETLREFKDTLPDALERPLSLYRPGELPQASCPPQSQACCQAQCGAKGQAPGRLFSTAGQAPAMGTEPQTAPPPAFTGTGASSCPQTPPPEPAQSPSPESNAPAQSPLSPGLPQSPQPLQHLNSLPQLVPPPPVSKTLSPPQPGPPSLETSYIQNSSRPWAPLVLWRGRGGGGSKWGVSLLPVTEGLCPAWTVGHSGTLLFLLPPAEDPRVHGRVPALPGEGMDQTPEHQGLGHRQGQPWAHGRQLGSC
ncbi:zinc finger protein RFP-like isoform X1 [Pelodiscus sinensis]|uniref:zinc finger protein RFP-like isoform X1 n=1 Tax=Pelodiscus sinensis TaxID=13735 RepID=UPI003F6D07BE